MELDIGILHAPGILAIPTAACLADPLQIPLCSVSHKLLIGFFTCV
jgi:hypothetical protein